MVTGRLIVSGGRVEGGDPAGERAGLTARLRRPDPRGGRRFSLGVARPLAAEAPADLALVHAEALLFAVDRGRILQADDLVEQRLSVDASFAVDRPPLAIV